MADILSRPRCVSKSILAYSLVKTFLYNKWVSDNWESLLIMKSRSPSVYINHGCALMYHKTVCLIKVKCTMYGLPATELM